MFLGAKQRLSVTFITMASYSSFVVPNTKKDIRQRHKANDNKANDNSQQPHMTETSDRDVRHNQKTIRQRRKPIPVKKSVFRRRNEKTVLRAAWTRKQKNESKTWHRQDRSKDKITNKTRQDKTRRDKTRQDTTRQTTQDRTRQIYIYTHREQRFNAILLLRHVQ